MNQEKISLCEELSVPQRFRVAFEDYLKLMILCVAVGYATYVLEGGVNLFVIIVLLAGYMVYMPWRIERLLRLKPLFLDGDGYSARGRHFRLSDVTSVRIRERRSWYTVYRIELVSLAEDEDPFQHDVLIFTYRTRPTTQFQTYFLDRLDPAVVKNRRGKTSEAK